MYSFNLPLAFIITSKIFFLFNDTTPFFSIPNKENLVKVVRRLFNFETRKQDLQSKRQSHLELFSPLFAWEVIHFPAITTAVTRVRWETAGHHTIHMPLILLCDAASAKRSLVSRGGESKAIQVAADTNTENVFAVAMPLHFQGVRRGTER